MRCKKINTILYNDTNIQKNYNTYKKLLQQNNNPSINNNLSTQPSRGVEMNDVIFPIDKQPDSISITNEIIAGGL